MAMIVVDIGVVVDNNEMNWEEKTDVLVVLAVVVVAGTVDMANIVDRFYYLMKKNQNSAAVAVAVAAGIGVEVVANW